MLFRVELSNISNSVVKMMAVQIKKQYTTDLVAYNNNALFWSGRIVHWLEGVNKVSSIVTS